MSEQAVLYLSIAVAVVVIPATVVMLVAVWKMLRSAQESGEGAAAQQAAAQGWSLESKPDGFSIDRRWTGTSHGIDWSAEYLAPYNRNDVYRRHEFRWTAAITNGPSSPLLLIHERSKLAKLDSARRNTPGFLSGLVDTATDKVLDLFFGRAAGARTDMSRLQPVEGLAMPGFQLMAEHPADALDVFERTLRAPLSRLDFSGRQTAVVLLLDDGVHLALRDQVSTADLERAVELGSSLAAAFGRTSSAPD